MSGERLCHTPSASLCPTSQWGLLPSEGTEVHSVLLLKALFAPYLRGTKGEGQSNRSNHSNHSNHSNQSNRNSRSIRKSRSPLTAHPLTSHHSPLTTHRSYRKAKWAGMSPVRTFHRRRPSGEKQKRVPGLTWVRASPMSISPVWGWTAMP